MRRKTQKVRCVKMKLNKCQEVCRAYDRVQEAFARMLAIDNSVAEFVMNVSMDFSKVKLPDGLQAPKEPHTTDFLIKWTDGRQGVRESLYRNTLSRPSVAVKLQLSKTYWQQQGISDWGIIIEKKEGEQQ